MAEDDRAVAEGSASWGLQGGMGLHLCGSRLQPRSHAESGTSSGLSQDCNVSDGSKKDVLATSGSGPSVLRVTKSRNQNRFQVTSSFFRSLLEWSRSAHVRFRDALFHP